MKIEHLVRIELTNNDNLHRHPWYPSSHLAFWTNLVLKKTSDSIKRKT